jgi:hypothetical protein
VRRFLSCTSRAAKVSLTLAHLTCILYSHAKCVIQVDPVAAAIKVKQESSRIEQLLVQNGAMQRAQSSLDATLDSGSDYQTPLWHWYDDNHYTAVDA